MVAISTKLYSYNNYTKSEKAKNNDEGLASRVRNIRNISKEAKASNSENAAKSYGIVSRDEQNGNETQNAGPLTTGKVFVAKSKVSVNDSLKQYNETLKNTRTNTKETAVSLKQLRYNFKNISSQLARSKTSVNAKQVASKARREVVKLKQKLVSGQYDKEELSAAITHAQSMERAANKKARHLLEEELVKVTDEEGFDTSRSNLEDEMEAKIDAAYKGLDKIREIEEMNMSEDPDIKELAEMVEMSETPDIMDFIEASEDDVISGMMDVMSDTMKDMLEETLGELADSLLIISDTEMNEEELKTFKIKHRNAEDKDIMEADAKYLKALFDNYSKNLQNPIVGNVFQEFHQFCQIDVMT